MQQSRTRAGPAHWAAVLFYAACGLLHRMGAALLRGLIVLLGRLMRPLPWSCRFGLLSALLCVVCLDLGMCGEEWLFSSGGLFDAKQLETLAQTGILNAVSRFASLLVVLGFVQLANALFFSFVRSRLSLAMLKTGLSGFVVLWTFALFFVFRVPGSIYAQDAMALDKFTRNELIVTGLAWWLPVMLLALLGLGSVLLRSVRVYYTGEATARPLFGDRLLRNLREHGRDPEFRKALYWAAVLHIALIVGPLLCGHGCRMRAYGIPKGDGVQVVQKVVVKRIKKKKKRELVLNLNSPILYYVPDLKDSKVTQELDEQTLDTYVASSLQTGKGKGGRSGWPHGMENARVRFIRLKYDGGDWDQDMGKGADYNFLLKFRELTGFRIADGTEHIEIRDLRRFPKHRGPPFVFITGKGGINVSSRDINVLRWYCKEEGGLIFADNGGGHFNGSFRRLMTRAFPDLEWVDIASDDILFLQPYMFPGGAPPLWHHSGDRVLGLKHGGRWIVIYHQGDLNDAWKTGHSGAEEYVAEEAYRFGVNVVNYAFNQYMRIHYGE